MGLKKITVLGALGFLLLASHCMEGVMVLGDAQIPQWLVGKSLEDESKNALTVSSASSMVLTIHGRTYNLGDGMRSINTDLRGAWVKESSDRAYILRVLDGTKTLFYFYVTRRDSHDSTTFPSTDEAGTEKNYRGEGKGSPALYVSETPILTLPN